MKKENQKNLMLFRAMQTDRYPVLIGLDHAAPLFANGQARLTERGRRFFECEKAIDMLKSLEARLAPGPWGTAFVDPLFRVLTSLIFIVGGLGHFRQHDVMLKRMAESPWAPLVNRIGDPSLLLWLSGLAFVIAGVTLALGWMTRASALILFVTLVPVTIAIHVVPDTSHIGPLFKNIAILSALLCFWARGPGAHALDNLQRVK